MQDEARIRNVVTLLSQADLQSMKKSACIALVEDDHDLRQSTEEFLTQAGYRVWGVGSAEAFFRQFAADPPNVVLLDIGLPGEDGFGVAALLKANPAIAVIILSARDALDDRLKGMNAGADRYLVKPVNLVELAANIDAVWNRLALSVNHHQLELPRPMLDAASSQWSLNQQTWCLTAPNGDALQLTAREFALVHRLIQVQGQAVPKKVLANDIFGPRIANASDRLNVLLARLRKKADAQLSEPLPIKTAHQIGYAFTAAARIA
jgi:DNA-binding response OmpR family regulator